MFEVAKFIAYSLQTREWYKIVMNEMNRIAYVKMDSPPERGEYVLVVVEGSMERN